MATAICASSNHSPTLPSMSFPSSSPTKPTTLVTLNSPPHSPSSLSLVFDDSFTAVALANAAVQAARDAVSAALAVKEMSENDVHKGELSVVSADVRRKKRIKRRKGRLESLNLETRSREDCSLEVQLSFKSSSRSVFLTTKEEAEFTHYLKEGARLEAARKSGWKSGQCEPTSSQWAEIIGMKRNSLERTLCKARDSRERIILSYRRLVVSIANAYQNKGLSLQDLIQEGSIGLLRGAERFDPKKGFKLSTYVYWWIKQAMIRAIANKSRLIRSPGSMSEMVPKIAEANTVLSRRLKRKPTIDEIALMIGMHVSRVRLLLDRSRPPISLDRSLTDDGHMTMQDIIAGSEDMGPEMMVKKQLMKQEVEKLLETLNEREAIIVRLHFGLSGETPRTFDDIGKRLKLSRERVRQIHCIAFTKLKHIDNIDNLGVYIM